MNYLVVQLGRVEAVVARFTVRRGNLLFLEGVRHELNGEHILPPLLQGIRPAARDERVILVLQPDHVFSREVDLPINDRRRLREIVPMELAGETVLESDDLVFDAMPLQEGKALAVWGRRRDLAEKIQMLAAQHIEPEVVTVSACHWREILPQGERHGISALTDGESLTVFSEGALLFWRSVAGDDPVAEVGRTLDLLEVGKGIEVQRVLFHGRHLSERDLASAGGREWMPLPVDGAVAAVFGDEKAARDLLTAFAASAAVQKGNAVNFRSGTLAYTAGRVQMRKRLRLSGILAACLALLLCSEAGLRYYLVQRDLASLNSSVALMYREVFPARKKAVDEVAELKSEIKRLGNAGGGSVLTLLNKVATLKGDDITGIYEAEIEGDQVRLKGDARSIQAVNEFKTRSAAIFSASDVGEMKTRPDGGVSFLFRGTFAEVRK